MHRRITRFLKKVVGEGTGEGGTWRTAALWASALGLFPLFVFLPGMQGPYTWDDFGLIRDNSALRQPGGITSIWASPTSSAEYYPMTHSTFWLQFQATGEDFMAFHLVNVLLHGANAILVFLLLSRLSIPGAWLAAAVFAVHPVEVEAVAWMSQRKTVLSAFFFLTSVYAFLAFEDTKKTRWFLASLSLFALALLSKTAAVVMPLVLVLIAWWRGTKLNRSFFIWLTPFFVLAIAAGIIAVYVENFVLKAEPPLSLNIAQRLAIAGWIPWFYLYKIVLPVDLRMIYPQWSTSVGAHSFVGGVLLMFAVYYLWRRRDSWGRGPLFGLGYFLVCLIPVLGLVNVDYMRISFVADHFQYLASIGAIALACSGIVLLARRFVASKPILARAGAVGLIATLSVLAWHRAAAFANPEELWSEEIRRNPASWMAYANLAHHLREDGAAQEAYEVLLEGHRFRPQSPEINVALGNYHYERGEFEKAIEFYDMALAEWPYYGQVYSDVGVYLIRQGKEKEGLGYLYRGFKLMPYDQDIKANLALALVTASDPDVRNPQEGLRLSQELCDGPQGRTARNLLILGLALLEVGRRDEAVKTLKSAVETAEVPKDFPVVDLARDALKRAGEAAR